ncbi:MAG: hypothetical protein J0I34_01285 [Pseudonocardia sp.]|uniref:hypothetical protein n=1 Tax=unclassified Pseudonocardia TaxID=2619320 RepID=UPI00086E6152|nr:MULTISPECIES: hypothetical protein [unclassified Pseudonocardia]MBN9107389.1 hypothetical protein [Pseudonocardia sp.]ODU26647.1 MAG: hypothetical protein ABS80_06470 [Pseudonocardia sp. SCN 72-51]ODV06622.1 MAG: hypothetical protein ABT15_12460 [Pseudonocardia sp. SCN 73-27]
MGLLLRGVAAGAAGTTALNTATYLDMLGRARPAGTSPEETVRRLVERRDPTLLGRDEDAAGNRRSALGALMGIATGTLTGAVLGAVRPRLGRNGFAAAALLAAVLANAGSVLPMWALGVSDPRTWSAASWVSDALPHLAYGLVTAAALEPGEAR